jgi:GPH family glycoside/pentoside/hexuronide:cation symporter
MIAVTRRFHRMDDQVRAPVGKGQAGALPVSLSIAWGSGSFCQTLVIYGFGVIYFRYLTDTVGIGPALVGSLIAGSKLYDAAITPAIGWLTDSFDTRMGRRRPWMLIGGLFMAASLALGFDISPVAPMNTRILHALIALLLYSTGYSFFAIPWLAMPPEMSGIPTERTRMMAWRVGFSSLAQTVAAASGPMLLSALGMGVFAYRVVGLQMAALCLVSAILTVYFTRAAPQRALDTNPRPALFVQFGQMLRNRPFVILVAVKICIYFGLALSSAAMALLTRWLLHVNDYWLGAFTIVTTVSMLCNQPLWLWLARTRSKRFALGTAIAIFALTQLSLIFNHGSAAMLMVQGVFFGMGSGGVFMLSQALLPDVIDDDNRRYGIRRAGSYAAVIALLEMGSSAAALLAMGLLLSHYGYVQAAPIAAGQPENARMAIMACAGVIPAVAEVLAIIFLSRFRLGEAGDAVIVR